NPNDDALYATNIKCTFWTDPFTQGYNNYDISYTRGTPITYAVSIADSFASTTGSGNYVPGVTVTINAGNREGYTFTRWSVTAGSVALSNINSVTATFTMPDRNVAITAIWTANDNGSGSSSSGGGGSGSGGGSSSSPSTSTPTPNSTPSEPSPTPTCGGLPTDGLPYSNFLLIVVVVVVVTAVAIGVALLYLRKGKVN
ncbi:MAG: hypothetical protein FWH37_07785, partial [Candidatus Bathyarchaeota archaeon]|nr:hypothetical protein [Candidatus Termiticorpusculum sp.]